MRYVRTFLWRAVFVEVLVNVRQFEIKSQLLTSSVGLAVDLVPGRAVVAKNGSCISAHLWLSVGVWCRGAGGCLEALA